MSIGTYPPQDQVVTLPTVRTEAAAFDFMNASLVPIGFQGWPDASTNVQRVYFVIPESYAPGGSVVVNVYRRSLSGSGTAVMRTDAYRFRDSVGYTALESSVGRNFTATDTNTHVVTLPYAGTSFQAGDCLRVDFTREGAHASDTMANFVDCDGVSVSYNSWQVSAGSSASPLPLDKGGTNATTAAQARTNLGLGTMAQQNANAVAITGGTAALGGAPTSDAALNVRTLRASINGINFYQDADSGSYGHAYFRNAAGAAVGTIISTATATAYGTTSDIRLKHAITALTGALDVVRVLRPVSFLWNADGSPGRGFLAHELQQTIPDAVTGLPDEVNPDGSIKPQQVDHGKLVPWLTACCQELAAQVQALQLEVAALKGAAA